MELFREEVLQERAGGWLGGIALVQPLATRILVLAGLAVVASVVLFLCTATYTWRASVSGQLVPTRGLATVVAPVQGVVAEVSVNEGDTVAAGQPLVRLAVPWVTAAGETATEVLRDRLRTRRASVEARAVARREIADRQASGLHAQLAATQVERARIDAEIRARQAQLALAEQSLSRLRLLMGQNYVSATQVELQQGTVLEHASQIQAMHRQAAVSDRAIAQLRQAMAELPGQMRSEEADTEHQLAQLGQEAVELDAREGQALRSPVDGVVSSHLAKAGQSVELGQLLLSVMPADEMLEAELWVPSRAIGFIEPGDAVQLRYHAFPYQKFGHQQGTVRLIGRSALVQRPPLAQSGAGDGETYYRVIVSLHRQSVIAYGREEVLRPDMRVDADILGERRRLIEWVFEPLYSIRGRVSARRNSAVSATQLAVQ